MNLDCRSTVILGCFEILPRVMNDSRGAFVKTFQAVWFQELGLRGDRLEQYYSVSLPGVLRGIHFQLPPHEHAKLAYCVSGRVLDVAVDIRRKSPTFGQFFQSELSASKGNMVYLDAGLALGFCTLDESAMLVYNLTSVYEPSSDPGIRWDSAGIQWPSDDYLLSERDCKLPGLYDFKSPFIFDLPSDGGAP